MRFSRRSTGLSDIHTQTETKMQQVPLLITPLSCAQVLPEWTTLTRRATIIQRSRRTSGRNQPSPKEPGAIDESIDLSRDR
jgi:hypothetical protein